MLEEWSVFECFGVICRCVVYEILRVLKIARPDAISRMNSMFWLGVKVISR